MACNEITASPEEGSIQLNNWNLEYHLNLRLCTFLRIKTGGAMGNLEEGRNKS